MNFPVSAINTIGFPGLGIQLVINNIAFSIGNINIYWYGLIIALGVLLAYMYAVREARRTGFDENIIADILLIGLPSAIIFARLYYVVFSWKDYAENVMDIFKLWEGGIAIYGAVIGAVISSAIYCKVRKIRFMRLADIAAPALLIGQVIGRWGNFVNAEAHGSETTLPWRMQIVESGSFIAVHPTFLYESLWNLIGLCILLAMRKRKPFTGFLFWAYLLWYGIGRFFIEGLRTDSLMLGNARVSQLVALICVIVAAFVIAFKWSHGIDEDELRDMENAATRNKENDEQKTDETETYETELSETKTDDNDIGDGGDDNSDVTDEV